MPKNGRIAVISNWASELGIKRKGRAGGYKRRSTLARYAEPLPRRGTLSIFCRTGRARSFIERAPSTCAASTPDPSTAWMAVDGSGVPQPEATLYAGTRPARRYRRRQPRGRTRVSTPISESKDRTGKTLLRATSETIARTASMSPKRWPGRRRGGMRMRSCRRPCPVTGTVALRSRGCRPSAPSGVGKGLVRSRTAQTQEPSPATCAVAAELCAATAAITALSLLLPGLSECWRPAAQATGLGPLAGSLDLVSCTGNSF